MITKTQKIKEIIDFFFEEPSVQEIYLKFNEPIELTKQEYEMLRGVPDSTGGAVNDNIILDHFVYDEEDENGAKVLAKMNVEYYNVDEDKLAITEISMWREKKPE